MSKKEFLEELEVLLGELPKEEREEALHYYESYFEEAGAEQEHIVLEELGSAGRIAVQILRDYRMEQEAGMYTEQGYREEEANREVPARYVAGAQEHQNASEENRKTTSDGSGVHVTKKGLSGMPLVLVILLAVFTFPLWISVLATAFGLLVGLVCGGGGIIFGFGMAAIGLMVGGVVTFFAALVKLFAVPIVGTGLLAAALIMFGVGSILFTVAAGLVHLAVFLVKTVAGWLSRLFHGEKEAVA